MTGTSTRTSRSIRTASKRGRSAKGGLRSIEESDTDIESNEATAVVENKSIPPLETPRVLSRNVITSLTHGLDASDVLECYSLVRSAPLHGIADSTIRVQKMTIGIRFRPTAADLKNPYNVKTPMELTLEYGPARLGPLLSDEATPIVHGNDESSSYLAWDNVGKVYFTQKIVAENFLSSHYMASMTGAVLNKLLHEAVEYTEKRTIYQPFAVYSDKGKQLLRSSSSTDFAWFVWSHLARLGVEIEPILPPSMYEVRLHVKSASKVFPDQSVTVAAAAFYQKLYDCIESIASSNYGAYVSARNQKRENNSDAKKSASRGNENTNGNNRLVDDLAEEAFDEDSQELEVKNSEDMSSSTLEHDDGSNDHSETGTANGSDDTSLFSSSNSPSESNQETSSPTLDIATEEPSHSSSPSPVPTESIHDVEKAQNAAQDAQKAADEAKNAAKTEGETKAADAAQAAADAALAAADATSSAASQAAKDSLLSGDGTMMSSIISTCFSNPRYEISSTDANGTAGTEIFLFRDPSSYYKLELTSPYLEVVKLNRDLPNAATLLLGSSAGGDALDWTLALSIVFLMFLMVLLICQQMGKHYVGAIYKCQRWYFNPRKYDYEGESVSGVQSGSHFFFGASGIPISMGGRRSSYSPLNNRGTIQDAIVNKPYKDEDGDMGEIEPQTMPPAHVPSSPLEQQQNQRRGSSQEIEMKSFTPEHHNHSTTNSWRENSEPSIGSANEDEITLDIPERLLRNPDLVEMPSLKSKSKVAIPVGSNAPYVSSSSFAEGSVGSSM
eukprot:jgi/Psemu1/321579/estExt_fgenesh1_pg.C_50040